MKFLRKILSVLLVLSMLLTSGIVEVMATSYQTQGATQSVQKTTGPLVDLSDMFAVSETEPESEAEPQQEQPDTNEPETIEVAHVENVTAIAASPVSGESQNFTYTVLEDGSCSITGYTGEASVNIEIPDQLDGYSVGSIGNRAFAGISMKSIVLPDTVTSIGSYAFQNCAALESIQFGNSLQFIGNYAFSGCAAFPAANLPDTVESIGTCAFQNCRALASFSYPAGLKEASAGITAGIFTGCTALESIEIPEGVTAIPAEVFCYAGSLKSVKLPSTLTSIGKNAFEYSGIVSIVLPDSVNSIGNYAFYNCAALESIQFGNSLQSIGNYAFSGCTTLTAANLPDTVESIGTCAFQNCKALASFNYPAGLKEASAGITAGIFTGCTALESIEIPEGITAIPAEVFCYANYLKSVALPSTLTSIGNNAFEYSGIVSIVLPDSVTSIGNYAFYNCAALEPIQFSNSLQSIGSYAFSGCAALTTADLPDTVESIGTCAFQNCKALASFSYPANLKEANSGITVGIFTGCTALESIEIPEGVTAIPAEIFYYANSLRSVKLPSTLTSIGNSAFYNSGIVSIVLPDSVSSIGNYAFYNCAALGAIQFGNSLQSIGNYAFSGCTALTAADLPDTVESIGFCAFRNCRTLASFSYPADLKEASSDIYYGIFSGCIALESLEIPEGVTSLPANIFYYAESLKSLKLPSTLTSIGNNAFENSGIISIELPDNVSSIGDYAFYNCTALESIQFGNSLQAIGNYAFARCTALTAIDLPDTVESIGSAAFNNCSALASFTYPANLKTVGSGLWTGIFTGCTALESIEVPEGVTALPANIFYYSDSLKSLKLPSTLTTVGDSAFQNSNFAFIDLPESVTTIGNSAFENCTSLKSIQIGNSLQSIGNYAFSGCTGLSTITIPETVESIGSGAFKACTALSEIALPEALKTIGAYAFQNCTALESVIFCDGVTELQSQIFSDCRSLHNVHLPRTLKQIQFSAFANCTSLTEIYIPNSVTYIANNAFSGISEITFLCELLSYATEFALDRQIPIIPTRISDEEISSPLNTENSYYIHNYDGLSASGVMSMVVHYEMKEDAGVSPTAITIHIYDFAALQENTLTLDGVLCTNYEYDEETGRLTVPVEASSGTLRFCMKPLRYEALTSYARLICKDGSGSTSMALIGSVNTLMPVLNITARTETSQSTVYVSGLAIPEADVSLYVDGKFAQTVKANKVGDYSADVSLGEPVDGKEYIITAEAADRNGAVISAQTNVLYRYAAPELVDFVMIYDSHMTKRISLLEMQGLRPVITFNPNVHFRFEVNFTNAENLSNVYVVSTRNNVKKYLKAYWDENLGVFVAEGFFDPFDHTYVPGVLSLEYICGDEKISFDQEIDFSSQEAYDALPQVWKDADIEVLMNTEERTVLDVTVGYDEDQISFELTNITQSIPQHITEENIEDYGYIKVTDDYGKSLYVNDYSEGDNSIAGEPSYVTIMDFATGRATNIVIDKVVDFAGQAIDDVAGASGVYGLLNIVSSIKDYDETNEKFDNLQSIYQQDESVSASEKKHFDGMVDAAKNVNTVTTVVGCIYTAVSTAVGIVYPPAGAVLFVTGVLSGILINGIRAYVNNDMMATAYGVEAKFKWAIDPSGYVYDSVTGDRLSGVTVHAYWIENAEEDPSFFDNKPADTEYGVLWNSLEFSQLNPLVTDEEGRYAWDVPEGWWRVSYEKEGYESTWSEWLPVPPPQTEVNIGMIPHIEGHTHTIVIIPGKDATCLTTGLTEGKSCSACNIVFVPQEIIQPLGHDKVSHEAHAANCTEIGWNAYETCSRCDYSTYQEIGAKGHADGTATCKDKAVCSRCLQPYSELNVSNHVGGKEIRNSKAATCSTTGYSGDTYCLGCNAKIAAGKKIATSSHLYNNNVDGTCNVCSVHREEVEIRNVVHMFRMYNPNTGEHFYTGSTVERDNLIGHGWQYEGVGFTFPANTGAPVHRLFHEPTGEHLYTMDEAEKDALMAEGWNYEGIAFNSAYDTEAVQHRLHNPNANVGAYHFTFSIEEKDFLMSVGWEYQGIGWYSCWK